MTKRKWFVTRVLGPALLLAAVAPSRGGPESLRAERLPLSAAEKCSSFGGPAGMEKAKAAAASGLERSHQDTRTPEAVRIANAAETSERLPMLSNEDAWRRLPGSPEAVDCALSTRTLRRGSCGCP